MIGNLALILAIPMLLSSGMNNHYSFSVNEDSWLSLSGSSSINSFECVANSEVSKGNLIVSLNDYDKSIHFANALLKINVKSFDCKNPLLNKDLYKALGVENSPYITIELLEASPQKKGPSGQFGSIRASVSVTINGKCKIVDIPIDWYRVDKQIFRFTGHKELCMSDLEIEPPSPAFGLIKVNNDITIIFNLLVEANSFEVPNSMSETI